MAGVPVAGPGECPATGENGLVLKRTPVRGTPLSWSNTRQRGSVIMHYLSGRAMTCAYYFGVRPWAALQRIPPPFRPLGPHCAIPRRRAAANRPRARSLPAAADTPNGLASARARRSFSAAIFMRSSVFTAAPNSSRSCTRSFERPNLRENCPPGTAALGPSRGSTVSCKFVHKFGFLQNRI